MTTLPGAVRAALVALPALFVEVFFVWPVAAIIAQHQRSPVPVAAFNVFLPRDLKIVGPNVDEARLARYVDNALVRVHRIGAQIVVDRRLPAGRIGRGEQPAAAIAADREAVVPEEIAGLLRTQRLDLIAPGRDAGNPVPRAAFDHLAQIPLLTHRRGVE